MKSNIIGSLTGLTVVIAADLLIRVILSLTLKTELLLFQYKAYPQLYWGVLVCLLTFVTSFIGGAVAVRNSETKKTASLVLFGVLLMALRYGQIHYIMDVELLLPIVALVLSLGATILVWKFFLKNRKETIEEEPPAKTHHRPNTNDA